VNARDKSIWLEFVSAEKAYVTAMATLRNVDAVEVLREGLLNAAWRRPALLVIGFTDVKVAE
jgi:hypothetical protein